MDRLLADARRGGYAVCYCESWNLESLQAVVEGAREAVKAKVKELIQQYGFAGKAVSRN